MIELSKTIQLTGPSKISAFGGTRDEAQKLLDKECRRRLAFHRQKKRKARENLHPVRRRAFAPKGVRAGYMLLDEASKDGLRALMKAQKITSRELAKKAGISERNMAYILSSKLKSVKKNVLEKLKLCLGIE